MCIKALLWFKSYICGRHQSVTIAGKVSTQQPILCGIPQGSVLGSKVATLSRSTASRIIYMTFKPTDMNFKIAADNIQNSISEVVSWMEQNFLKLNKDKTFTSKHRQDLCNTLNIKIGNNLAVCKLHVKNPGVTLDNVLSMESHVRTV